MMNARPYINVRTTRLASGELHKRVYLFCPDGHEVVSMGATTRSGQRVLAGDYRGEFCGYGSCDWTGGER